MSLHSRKSSFFIWLFSFFLGISLAGPAQAIAFLAPLIAAAIAVVALNLAANLSSAALTLSTFLLQWVTSENFISWSYTGPDNPVVQVGWGITRDLVNMSFVVILAFVGLATALRLREYQIQTTLPKLALVVLLINFTPVIAGAIIDATNIATYFFLEKLSGLNVLEQQSKVYMAIIHGKMGSWYNPASIPEKSLVLVGLTAFNVLASLLVLLLSVIFAGRYIALWILVIISPVAFLSYIFGPTRKLWTSWWNWFTQWAIIGVPLAFFLYLANHILIQAPRMLGPAPPSAGVFTLWLDALNAILPYGIAVGFLAFGLFMGLHSTAFFSGELIKQARVAGEWTGQKALSAARGLPMVGQGEEKARKWLEAQPLIGRALGGRGAFEKEKQAGLKKTKEELDKIPATPAGNDALWKRVEAPALTREDRVARAAALELLAERGAIPAGDKAGKYLQEMEQWGGNKNAVLARRPDLAKFLVKPLAPGATPAQIAAHKASQMAEIQKQMRNISPLKAREIQAEALQDPQVAANLSKAQVADLRNGTPQQREALIKAYQKMLVLGGYPLRFGVPLPNPKVVPIGCLKAGGVNRKILEYLSGQQGTGLGIWPIV